jgi:hypothetical protein
MTVKQVFVAGAVIVGAAAAVEGILIVIDKMSDEAPIRVKGGGSIEITPAVESNGKRWRWEPKGGDETDGSESYSHEPSSILNVDRERNLYVKVYPPSLATRCTKGMDTGSGRTIIVEYSGRGYVIFKRGASGVYNRRTKIRRKTDLAADERSGSLFFEKASKGYIKSVMTDGPDSWDCQFGEDDKAELEISHRRQERR